MQLADRIADLALSEVPPEVFRARLLELLSRTIGFDKGSLHATRVGVGAENCSLGFERPERFEELPRLMAEFEPHEVAAASSGRPMVDVDTLSLRRRDQLALYRQLLRPERVTVFTTAMWRAEGAVAGLALARTGRGARFTRAEVTAIERALPAIRLGEALAATRRPPFEAWASSVRLSPRERELVGLIMRGLTNGEAAAVLRLSPHTVRNMLVSIFRKAHVSTRAELTFAATALAPQRSAALPDWLEHVR